MFTLETLIEGLILRYKTFKWGNIALKKSTVI